jgi:perosamine synthetase
MESDLIASGLEEIVARVRAVVGDARTVELHEPTFAGREWQYVKDCLDSGWVSSAGAFVERFERSLCEHTNARHAVAVVNGTAALQVALMLAGVRVGDEVLVPSLTFAATANAVVHCGAVPHFVESTWATLGIDPTAIEAYLREITAFRDETAVNRQTGRPIRAIVPVHIFGHPVDVDTISDLAGRFHLSIVEDASEALGSSYRGRPTGSASRLAVLSFNGNKIVTTGGGGAVLTNDAEIAKRCKHLTTTAKRPHRWAFEHDEVAFNYRMPNLNAALGCAQLEQLESFVSRKRALADRYMAAFAGSSSVTVFREPAHCRSNYWLNALVLGAGLASRRDDLLAECHAQEIRARPPWRLLHELAHFSSAPRMSMPIAKEIQSRVVNVPSSPFLARY